MMRRILASLAALVCCGLACPPAAAATAVAQEAVPASQTAVSDAALADVSLRSDSEESENEGPKATIEITSVGAPILNATTDLTVTATVNNPTDEELTVYRFQLGGSNAVASSRSGLLRFLDGYGEVGFLARSGEDTAIPAHSSGTLTLTVERTAIGWGSTYSSWGPHGIEFTASTDQGFLEDRSFVVVAPTFDIDPMPTAVVVPLTDTPDAEWSIESALEESLAEEAEDSQNSLATRVKASEKTQSIDARIEGYTTPGVTLAIDPATIDTEASSEAIKKAATTSKVQVMLTPWGDTDIAALTSACGADCASRYLKEAIDLSGKAAEDIRESTGVLPRSDILVLPDEVGFDALHVASGMTLVLPSSTIPTSGGYHFPTALTDLGDSDGLVTDTAMSAALAGVMPIDAAADSSQNRYRRDIEQLSALDSRQLLLGLSAVTYLERPSDPRVTVIQVDRSSYPVYSEGTNLSEADVQGSIAALMSAPWVTPATVDDALASPLSTVERDGPGEVDVVGGVREEHMRTIDTGLGTYTALSTLTDSPEIVMDVVNKRTLELFSVAWRGSSQDMSAAVARFANYGRLTAEKIAALPSSTINVISTATEIPVTVSNPLPVPITVTADIRSWDPRVKSKKPVEVSLAANSTAKVMIPIEAFGSGNVTAQIVMLDPNGNVVGGSQELNLRIRANWEDIGTFAFGGFFLALLILGLVRSLRNGRRSRPISPQEIRQARHRAADSSSK